MNVEFADKPWFYQTMTREQAEQRLKRASDGVFLVRPSSQPACYAMSLKNQDHEIVDVVVGTLSSRTATGVRRRKSPFGSMWAACRRHSTRLTLWRLSLVRPLEMRGTLASSLTKSSFAGEVDRFKLASKAGLDRVCAIVVVDHNGR